jgi:hypothetical protein
MKNKYLIMGDTTIIYCEHQDGSVSEILIDTVDLERVMSVAGTWYASKTGPTSRSPRYAYTQIPRVGGPTPSGKTKTNLYMHRYLTDAPADRDVDHKDRNGLNNRQSNMRVVTTKENLSRRVIFNEAGVHNRTTGVRNVCFDKGKYEVAICGQYYGRFDTLTEAEAVATRLRQEINARKAA